MAANRAGRANIKKFRKSSLIHELLKNQHIASQSICDIEMSKRRASDEAGPSGYRPSKAPKTHETHKKLVSPVTSDDSGVGVEDPEHQEELAVIEAKLKKAVELYDNNKLTKENMWTLNYIDMFLNLSQRPQAKLDYRFVGQCIAAITKLYVSRLDQLYEDVCRLSASMGRQVTGDSRKRGRIEDDHSDDALPQPERSKVTVKKRSAKVTRNPESLNAKLQTKPPVDPFFAKVNSHVGDMKQADRMLMNLLPSRNGSGLSLSAPFWDTRDEPTDEPAQCSTRASVNVRPANTKNSVLRSTLQDYRLTGESHEELTPMMYVNLSDDDSDTEDSAQNFQFDTDTQSVLSAVVSQEEGYGTGNPHELTQSPINNETSSNSFIVDMEPLDAEIFEYTYRSSDQVSNFFAGPSHWKSLKPKTEIILKCGAKKKTRQRAANLKDLLLVRQMDLTRVDSILTTSNHVRQLHNFYFSGKTSFPHDFQVSTSIFERFENASINMNDPIRDLSDNLGFTSRLRQDYQADEDTMMAIDYDEFDINVDARSTQFALVSTPLTKNFANKSLMYAKRPRNFNMKRIRDLSLTVIENETANGNDVSFSQVDAKVSKMFKESQESTSCALTFLGILHAASEKKVELRREFDGSDSVEDFTIIHTGNSQNMEY